jgi:ATP-binding protein involved in chromosome partitioning
LPRRILISAIKGGVGKSTVTAQLGLALQAKGFRIGFLDCDLSGATLPSALGIPKPFDPPEVDVARDKMFPLKRDGYEIHSLAFRFGEAALLWKGSEEIIKGLPAEEYEHIFTQITNICAGSISGREKVDTILKLLVMRGTGRWQLIRQMLANVEFSPDLDYLLYDLPPQSGDEVLSLFENLKDIWGNILVCQPTNLATEDMDRALNMIAIKRIPLLGIVGNMVDTVCLECGYTFAPFLDAGVNLEEFCHVRGVPYLARIPLTTDRNVIRLRFELLAQRVLEIQPVKTWEKSFKERLEVATIKGVMKSMFKER